jgi:hypothetical protein
MDRNSKINKSQIFFNILSLANAKSRIITFLSVLVVLALIPISFLESMPDLSICHRILGETCYSVGITRGVSSMLKGDIEQSWSYNPLAIFTIIVIIGIIISDSLTLLRVYPYRICLV